MVAGKLTALLMNDSGPRFVTAHLTVQVRPSFRLKRNGHPDRLMGGTCIPDATILTGDILIILIRRTDAT